jgi:uncharacterized membrane protein (DUF2068 family)
VVYQVTDDAALSRELVAESSAGPALRCLRCSAFVLEPDAPSGPLADAPLVPRGTHGRRLFLIRLIALERIVRALLLAGVAVSVLGLADRHWLVLDRLKTLVEAAAPLAHELGWQIESSATIEEVQRLLSHSSGTYELIAAGLLGYVVLQLVEGFGLWGGHRWAEYLAVVATSLFLPLEVYEISHHVTALKVVTFVLNIAIVVYLVYRGRLFGMRGGHDAFRAEVDETTLLHELARTA